MSMKKKYRRTGSVILGIFIAAVLCAALVVFIVYQNGLRYIKSDVGIKFFGHTDKYGNIINGRLWHESNAASIQLQKFYIIESKNINSDSYLPDASSFSLTADKSGDISGFIESVSSFLPEDLTVWYPFNNFIFNQSDTGIFFRDETFDVLINDYENNGKKLLSGEIYASNGIKWVLVLPSSEKPPFYTDFEIVQAENNAKKYKGDILSFLDKEDINFASFNLSDGTVINLYPAHNIYRLDYDKGNLKGDLYIGKLNAGFEKDGKGLYKNKNGNIYYGDFIKGIKTGICELLSDYGDSYSGYITDGKKNGEGILKWSDGSSYEGTFTDNMKNGRGRYIFSDGSQYEGDYVNDVKHGRGKYIWSNGDYYEGDFHHNTLHGWGTYYWTSGRSYEGWWNLVKMVLPDEKPDDIDFDGDIDENDDYSDVDSLDGLEEDGDGT